MSYILLGISVVINVVFIAVLVNHKKAVKESIEQVRRINGNISQMKLKNYSTYKEYEKLILEINQLIEKYSQTKAHYMNISEQNKRMVSSISHDFRTPLTSMLGYIQLLEENPVDEKREYYLSIIEDRTKNLNELVNEFYLLSLLDSEKYKMNREVLNPIYEIQERVALYYNDLNNTFSTLLIELEEAEIEIFSSKIDFNRVVDNLIRNAILHGSDSFYVTSRIKDHTIAFNFSNTIDQPEKIQVDQLFERLYKGDSSRSKSSTGLGLAVAKELSKKLDFHLDAEIKGSMISFVLTIPI